MYSCPYVCGSKYMLDISSSNSMPPSKTASFSANLYLYLASILSLLTKSELGLSRRIHNYCWASIGAGLTLSDTHYFIARRQIRCPLKRTLWLNGLSSRNSADQYQWPADLVTCLTVETQAISDKSCKGSRERTAFIHSTFSKRISYSYTHTLLKLIQQTFVKT